MLKLSAWMVLAVKTERKNDMQKQKLECVVMKPDGGYEFQFDREVLEVPQKGDVIFREDKEDKERNKWAAFVVLRRRFWPDSER